MTSLRFVDTNILLYSMSRDPTETTRHDRAVALIDAGNNALSVQVLQELWGYRCSTIDVPVEPIACGWTPRAQLTIVV